MTWSANQWPTITELLRQRVAREPDSALFTIGATTYSAKLLDMASRRIAAGLAAAGVTAGDRVAIIVGNRPEMLISLFAVIRIGGIAVPINTNNRGSYLGHPIIDSGARLAIVEDALAPQIVEMLPDVATLTQIAVVGASQTLHADARVRLWSDLALAEEAPEPPMRPATPAAIIYTSGTTGPSKGCLLSHNYLVGRSATAQRSITRQHDDVLWTPLPLCHINGITFALIGTLLVGGSSVIAPRFSLGSFWDDVAECSATIASLMGSLAALIAKQGRIAAVPRELRVALAVPMTEQTERVWRDEFGVVPVSNMYGMTEVGPLSHLVPEADQMPGRNKPGAAGQLNDEFYEVRILDRDDIEVPPGKVGEIVCRPKAANLMFSGYWNRPAATAEACRNLWFHTGDLGRVDDDGYLYLVDRKVDYLRRRGENVSSQELEATFLSHEGIRQVAVCAVPSELGEDDIKVTVVPADSAALTEAGLYEWSTLRLPSYAVPRFVEFRTDLPVNAVGRVLKHVLRSEGVTAQTWDAYNGRHPCGSSSHAVAGVGTNDRGEHADRR
jgi:crotonobetaine/carnitine-CoA ligase